MPSDATPGPADGELRTLLGAALARIDLLEGEVTRLRSMVDRAAPPSAHDRSDQLVPGATVGRRRAIKGAALAAAGAVAGMVAVDSTPAAAADGDHLVLGSTGQAATAATGITIAGAEAANGLAIVDNVRPAADRTAAISAHAGGAVDRSFAAGLEILGEASALGAWIATDLNVGAFITSAHASAIHADSSGPETIYATNHSGDAVVGLTGGVGSGVRGQCDAGAGVFGLSDSGDALQGFAGTGTAVHGTTQSGRAVFAESMSGGGVAIDAPQFHLRLQNANARSAPTADTVAHVAGDVVASTDGDVWLCTVSGTPGTWRKVGGPATAGQFHVLPAPVRVYDSRVGTAPSQGPKTKLSGNVPRPIDCTVNASGVPIGASAVALTVLLLNAANTNGNLTVWANGAARPSGNTIVWGTGSGRYTTSTVSALDGSGKVQVSASVPTDLALDVVGYYR